MNKETGKATLDIDGKLYTLQFTTNAMVEVEDLLDMPLPALAALMEDPLRVRVGHVRALFWGGLIEHHPDLTVQDAGALMQLAGGMDGLMPKMEAAFAAAFPSGGDGAGNGKKKPPVTKKKAG